MEPRPDPRTVTNLLGEAAQGSQPAAEELVRIVYGELEKLARAQLFGERRDHTLGPSDLVHEAWLRLVGELEEQEWPSRRHFYKAAADAMRQVLCDHARRRGRLKRGGGRKRLTLNVLELAAQDGSRDFLEVDEAVRRLEEKEPRLGQIVRLRFYAGLTVQETAETLGVSEGTVYRDWSFARAWLYRILQSRE